MYTLRRIRALAAADDSEAVRQLAWNTQALWNSSAQPFDRDVWWCLVERLRSFQRAWNLPTVRGPRQHASSNSRLPGVYLPLTLEDGIYTVSRRVLRALKLRRLHHLLGSRPCAVHLLSAFEALLGRILAQYVMSSSSNMRLIHYAVRGA